MKSSNVRKAMFAGSWYPLDAAECEREIVGFLAEGKRIKPPDRLHLVIVQLQPKTRVTSRMDIDDPASHGELAHLLDQIDPAIPGSRQPRGQLICIVMISGFDCECGAGQSRSQGRCGRRERRRSPEDLVRDCGGRCQSDVR